MRNRAASAFALALLVLGQLGAWSHEAAVRHVRCVAHDELVEAAAVDAHSIDGTRFVGVGQGQGADEHCALAAALHQPGDSAPAQLALHTAPPVAVAAALPAPTAAPAAVYVFAPKTSPPELRVSIT